MLYESMDGPFARDVTCCLKGGEQQVKGGQNAGQHWHAQTTGQLLQANLCVVCVCVWFVS